MAYRAVSPALSSGLRSLRQARVLHPYGGLLRLPRPAASPAVGSAAVTPARWFSQQSQFSDSETHDDSFADIHENDISSDRYLFDTDATPIPEADQDQQQQDEQSAAAAGEFVLRDRDARVLADIPLQEYGDIRNSYDFLKSRGLISQSTVAEDSLRQMLSTPQTIYAGFDPTARSLHLGNLAVLTVMRHLAALGHNVICLIGSATASIGDPSGRTKKRQALSRATILSNRDKIQRIINRVMLESWHTELAPNSPNSSQNQLEETSADGPNGSGVESRPPRHQTAYLMNSGLGTAWIKLPRPHMPVPEAVADPSSGSWPSGRSLSAEDLLQADLLHQPGSVLVLDNLVWWAGHSLLQYLTEVGPQFRINAMLGKASVQARLGQEGEAAVAAEPASEDSVAAMALPIDRDGLTMREFSYQTLQAQDFFRLYQDWRCSVQVGGADQFGNISAGVDYIRRRRALALSELETNRQSIEDQRQSLQDLVDKKAKIETHGALLRPHESVEDQEVFAEHSRVIGELQMEINAARIELDQLLIQHNSLKSTEAVRHGLHQGEVGGFTVPLLTHSNGEKIGKSSSTGEPVFMSPDVTSPFELYQYLVRVQDNEVRPLLMTFTRIQAEVVERLLSHDKSLRLPQFVLANSLVTMLHGHTVATACEDASRFIYQATVQKPCFEPMHIYRQLVGAMVPITIVPTEVLSTHDSLLGLLVQLKVLPSMSQATKACRGGSLYVNQRRMVFDQHHNDASWIAGAFMVVRIGKRGIPQVLCRSDLHEVVHRTAAAAAAAANPLQSQGIGAPDTSSDM